MEGVQGWAYRRFTPSTILFLKVLLYTLFLPPMLGGIVWTYRREGRQHSILPEILAYAFGVSTWSFLLFYAGILQCIAMERAGLNQQATSSECLPLSSLTTPMFKKNETLFFRSLHIRENDGTTYTTETLTLYSIQHCSAGGYICLLMGVVGVIFALSCVMKAIIQNFYGSKERKKFLQSPSAQEPPQIKVIEASQDNLGNRHPGEAASSNTITETTSAGSQQLPLSDDNLKKKAPVYVI